MGLGDQVSSSRVRQALSDGKIDDVNWMLGREHRLVFDVSGERMTTSAWLATPRGVEHQNLLGSGGKPTSQRRSLHRSRIRRPITRRYHRDPDHGARTAFLGDSSPTDTTASTPPSPSASSPSISSLEAARDTLWVSLDGGDSIVFFVLARTHPLFFHSFNTIASLRGSGAERNRIVASHDRARRRTRDSTPWRRRRRRR